MLFRSLGTIRDVSDQAKAKEDLKQKQDELIEAQRIGNLGNWNQDLIKKEITWSNQIYEIFGIESSYEIAFDTIYDFAHPDDKELLKTVFNESVKEKKAYSLEYRIVLNDDSIRWVLEQAECVCDSNGNVIKVIGIVQDITEQKLASEKLLESENRYGAILENLNTGVVIHVNNKAVYVNDAIVNMMGYENEQSFIGKDVFDFVHPEDHTKILDAVNESSSNSQNASNKEIGRAHV